MNKRAIRIRRSVLCALFAALLAVAAWIQIPATIPFTLQTAVVCIAASLSGGIAALSVAVYLALGAVGLPVFSNFTAGWAVLVGPTAGYLWGFFLTVAVIAICKAILGSGRWVTAWSMAIGVALCYLAGTMWFALVYIAEPMSLQEIMAICVLPFLLPEIAKVALAAVITVRIRKTNLIASKYIS